MKDHIRKVCQVASVILMLFVASLLLPAGVQAQGVGISGNFYRQHFELSPGETASGDDIYVVVSNPTDSQVKIKMVTEAPPGVTLLLTQEEFTLLPGEGQKVNISVQASQQAAPGEHTLTISAEACREGTGIKVTSGGQQVARLTILGESGRVTINAISKKGEPFPTLISVYQEKDGALSEVRPPQKTELKARLTPGDYVIQAHYEDIMVAEESFSLAVDEDKRITLEISTIVFESFGVVPNYQEGTKRPASVGIVYTINNLYEPVSDVAVVLRVTRDGKSLDEISLTTMGKLDVDRVELSYNYVPAKGWEDGSYGFKLELLLAGKVYNTSPEEKLQVGGRLSPPGEIPWLLIVAIIGGVVVIGLMVALTRRRAY